MFDQHRLKVLRVVTTSECIPWHMENTLKRLIKDFEVCVAGEDVSIYQAAYPDIKWVDIPIARKVSPISDFCSLFSLCRLILEYKPDILHSIMPKAGLLSAMAGCICLVPVRIHTFTGQVWATKTGISRLFLKALDQLVLKLNTVCLTDSPSQSRFLYEENISLDDKPLPVLSKGSLSGVNISRFNRPEIETEANVLRQTKGIAANEFIFAFIARKSLDKGAIDVLLAFAKVVRMHPEVRLLFVGPDESDGEVDQTINSDPLLISHVLNIGKVDNHEVYLAISDVLCLPSYREGFGSIVIDAAAASVATIGSDIPGLVDAIENGKTGVLFPAGDIEQLAQIMRWFVENPEQVGQMGKRAKDRVDAYFTADILYEALKDLYFKQLINRRHID